MAVTQTQLRELVEVRLLGVGPACCSTSRSMLGKGGKGGSGGRGGKDGGGGKSLSLQARELRARKQPSKARAQLASTSRTF